MRILLRRAVPAFVAAACVATLTGCTNAGDTTCAQFNAQDFGKQSETLRNLLSEHDLEQYDVGNVQGVTAAVTSLCTSNDAATLDQATDWDADTW